MPDMQDQLVRQISSGRFILTVICGLSFGYMAITGILEAKDSLLIMTLVFSSYFQKPTETSKPENPKPQA